MNEEMKFLEKLNELREFAKENQNRISKDDVKQFFSEETLREEQMLLVYDYLLSQKIAVTGYMKNGQPLSKGEAVGTRACSSEEEAYLSSYREDLAALRAEAPGERERLFKMLADGDEQAKSRLIELYLPVVLDIALGMRCEEVFLGDLVQEGNVSLMLALDLLKSDSLEASEDALLRNEIRQGIQVMAEEQTELKRRDRKMEQKVNDLDEALHHLADEKGRGITIEELAEHMEISEEAILDIMKLAGEDLYDKYKDSEKDIKE